LAPTVPLFEKNQANQSWSESQKAQYFESTGTGTATLLTNGPVVFSAVLPALPDRAAERTL